MLIVWDRLGLKSKPKGVLHVGANTGEELEIYQKAGVPLVLWFECNRRVLPYLRMNVEGVPGHHVVEAAVSDKDGEELDFHQTNNDASSSLLELGEHLEIYPSIREISKQRVITTTVDSALRAWDYKPEQFDFANLDLQGYELKALRGMTACLPHLQWIYTEVNFSELYKGCCLVGELDDFLEDHGFKRILTADTGLKWGDAYYVKDGFRTKKTNI
jgi:FkbM family methyltransferase